MKKIETVSLIGLGAMGVFFAPKLQKLLGNGFRILADGERKERLETNGVVVNGEQYLFPIVKPETQGDPADLVIISVKGYALEQAIADVRNQVGEDTQILCVLNGVDSEEKVIKVYGKEHVLYSYMRVSIAMKNQVAEFDPKVGNIHFGEAINTENHYSERVLAIKDLFDRANINYRIDPDMIRGQWFKFMCNVGENMTCALLGIPFGAFQKSEAANQIRRGAMWEVIHIANQMGIDLSQEDINRQEATLGRLPYHNKPSTLQDLELGKRTEVEMFAGTVIRLGKRYGVPTPINEMFYHGIHALEEKNDGLI